MFGKHWPRVSRLKFGSKVLRTLIATSFLAALIPVGGAILLALNSLSVIETEIDSTREQAFSTAVNTVDWMYDYANMLDYRMAQDDTLGEYLKSPARNCYTEYMLRKNMVNYAVSELYVKSAYYYLKQYDYMLGTNHGADSARFLAAAYGARDDILNGIVGENRAALRVCAAKETDARVVLFVRKVTGVAQTAWAVIEIDAAALLESLHIPEGAIFVVCRGEDVVLANADAATARALEGSEQAELWLGDVCYRRLTMRSTASSLSYTLAMPLAATNASARFARRFAVCTLILCGAAALALAGVTVWRNYRPMYDLMAQYDLNPQNVGSNEYRAIEAALRNFISDNRDLSRRIDDSERRLRALYLRNLLRDRVQEKDSIRDTLTLYNIRFDAPCFAVALFPAFGETALVSVDDGEDGGYLIGSVLRDVIENEKIRIGCYVLEMAEHIAIVLNGEREALERLCELAPDRVANVIRETLHMEIVCYVSRVYEEIDRLPVAYGEVRALAESPQEAAGAAEDARPVSDLTARCVTLIREGYADSGLCVASAAQTLGVSASYLSRAFKQQLGVGLLEYMHRYRVIAAKELLEREPGLSIAEAAQRTGFYNAAALIRAFKKIEGITPGQFREGER